MMAPNTAPTRRVDHPILLGIIGDSGSGKTTLAAGIARILGADQVRTLCSDDYHNRSRAERTADGLTALNPKCNHIDILEQHLQLLRQGLPILKPVYDHQTGTLKPPVYITPRPYIIVDGLLGYHTRTMRNCFDVKVYLEPQENLRITWKMRRDSASRGYTQKEVHRELELRESDSIEFIQPQRTFADIVISFNPPEGDHAETGAHLEVRHLLRPTLPHPDLSPLTNSGAESGLSLELSRDSDGKPVDALRISGSIPDSMAQGLENLIWEMLPEAHHLRSNLVGQFTDLEGKQVISHPLALTQLLLTFHMVKAAHGVLAV